LLYKRSVAKLSTELKSFTEKKGSPDFSKSGKSDKDNLGPILRATSFDDTNMHHESRITLDSI
jgi:hypothetical protein